MLNINAYIIIRRNSHSSIVQFVTSERSERSSYLQSYMGRLDDIQTALKPLKKIEKIEKKFMTILGLAESFKKNEPARQYRSLTAHFSKFIKDWDVKF